MHTFLIGIFATSALIAVISGVFAENSDDACTAIHKVMLTLVVISGFLITWGT